MCIVILKGGKKYQIKGCAGQGGFAQVYKAYVNSNPDEVVALKVIAILVFSFLTRFLVGLYQSLKFLADTKACFPLGVLHVSSTRSAHLREGSMPFSSVPMFNVSFWF